MNCHEDSTEVLTVGAALQDLPRQQQSQVLPLVRSFVLPNGNAAGEAQTNQPFLILLLRALSAWNT